MQSSSDILKTMTAHQVKEEVEQEPLKLEEKYIFRNLFLTGKPGVGKTYLAKEILEANINFYDLKIPPYGPVRGKDVYKIFNCSELMFLSRKASTGEQLYYECIKARGLVLDDLGIGKRSDFIPDIIYIIIDKRLELKKPTIVTSNLGLGDIAELIDDRLASRLASYEYIEITGQDKRLRNLRKKS